MNVQCLRDRQLSEKTRHSRKVRIWNARAIIALRMGRIITQDCHRPFAIPETHERHGWVDGTDARTNAALVDLLRSIVVLSQREKANIEDYRSSWRT